MRQEPALTDDVGFLLSRAAARVAQATNLALEPEGLRVRSYAILRLACENPDGISQKNIAEVVGLDPSQVVALLDGLEKQELVARKSDPKDRRSKLLVATDQGRAVCSRTRESVDRAHADYLQQFPTWAVDGLRDTLRSIAFSD